MSYLSPFVALSDDELANMFHNSNTPSAESSFPFEQNVPEMLSNSENLSSCKYYSDSQFKENIPCKAPALSVFHLNIRSLPKNHIQLIAYMESLSYKFDIILLTEIGSSNVDYLDNILPDYHFDYVSPSLRCGGAGIYYRNIFSLLNVKKQVISSHLSCTCDNCQIEDIWLELSYNNKPFCVASCYRHPKGNIKHFVDALEKCLLSPSIIPFTILGGDFNIDLLKIDNCSIVNDYISVIMGHNFIPTINLPTRINNCSFSLIDNIFVKLPLNLIHNKIYSGNLYTDISDHLPNFCIIEGSGKQCNTERPLV